MASLNDTSKLMVAESAIHLFPELTVRQYEALEIFSCGAPQKQLSATMGVTIDTVKEHIEAVKQKYGCGSTLEIRYVYLSRVMQFLCSKEMSKNKVSALQNIERSTDLDKEKVYVLPQQRFFSILERSERTDIMMKLLSRCTNLEGEEMALLEMCVDEIQTINHVLHDMSAAHAESLECVETYELNQESPFYLMKKGLENDK